MTAARLVLARQRQRLGAVLRHQRLEALVVRGLEQHARVARIVLDDEHRAVALLDGLAIVLDALDVRHRQHRRRQRRRRRLDERRRRAAAIGRALVGQR